MRVLLANNHCISDPTAGVTQSLRTIVESVFDPAVDCVIYESPDGLELHGGDYGCLYVPRGAGLAAAATCGEALRRMGCMQFVVAVAALPDSGPASELERLKAVESIQRTLLSAANLEYHCMEVSRDAEFAPQEPN